MMFRGSGTALVTPFHEGSVDWASLEALLNAQVEGGTAALIACGTTGEPSTLTFEEQCDVVSFVVQHSGGLPVYAGIGGNNTAHVIDCGRAMADLGADGLLGVTPYYNKTTQDGLVAHYSTIADTVDLPLVIYNVPPRPGLNIAPSTTARLASHDRIVALKEANPSMSQILEDFRLCSDSLAIYSGNDDLTYPFLTLGGAGVISVASNLIPRPMHDIVRLFDEGDWTSSLALAQRYAPLIDLLFAQVSPLPVKAALAHIGLMKNELRLPLVPLTDEEAQPLFAELQRLGIE